MQIIAAEESTLYQKRSIELISDEAVSQALAKDAVAVKVQSKGLYPQHDDLVGVRLNLNILKSQKVAVQTLHAGNAKGGHTRNKGFYNGSVVGYCKVVTLREAYFNVSQLPREKIAAGIEPKGPMASIDGNLVDPANHSFDGIEARFNPKSMHLFADLENKAIRYAQDVTIYGHRAYCRGRIEYYSEPDAPMKVGESASSIVFADSLP